MLLSKLCRKCLVEKDIDDFISRTGSIRRFCHSCSKIKNREDHLLEISKNGGSKYVPNKPNVYKDKFQKENTFKFLELCGWQFNEENGIWWKEPLKTKDGNWPNIKPIKIRKSNATKYDEDGIALIFQYYRNNNYNKHITRQKFGLSQPTLDRYIRRFWNYWNDKNW